MDIRLIRTKIDALWASMALKTLRYSDLLIMPYGVTRKKVESGLQHYIMELFMPHDREGKNCVFIRLTTMMRIRLCDFDYELKKVPLSSNWFKI